MMWIAVLVATIVSGVASSPLHDVGPKDCAKGAEYWCTDLQNAKACGAVKYCIENVWENLKLPADNNEMCDMCKKMVEEAREQLKSNETQEEIKEVLEGTCRIYFPIKIIADQCIKFVDEFIPELIEMLLSRMDPQTVCATCGLCNAARLQVKIFAQAIVPHLNLPAMDCDDCKRFVGTVEKYLETATKQEVQNRLIALCNLIPQFTEECVDIVNQSFDEIYNFINTNLNPSELCSLVGLCDDTNKNAPKMRSVIDFYLDQVNNPECDFCQQIVQHLKDEITSNTTEEEFENVLLGICKHLGSFDQQCEQFVKENFKLIYDFIVNELDPKAICTALGLCSQSSDKQSGIPMMKLIPAKKQIQLESNDLSAAPKYSKNVHIKIPLSKPAKSPAYHELPVKSGSTITCALCEYALHEIQNLLSDNKTEEHIKHAIEQVCKILPKTLTDECTDFIEQYGDAILVLIAQELDPSIICTELKLCTTEAKVPLHVQTKFPMSKLTSAKRVDAADFQLPPNRLMPNVLAVADKNVDMCDMCETVVGVLHILLQDNKTKEAIENAVASVCNELPTQYQAACKDFIDEYADKLIDAIVEQDPETICAAIGICTEDKKTVQKASPGTCSACEVIVGDIEKLMQDETIDHDTAKVLEVVCYVVPKVYREQCVTYIDTYGPYILQMLGSLADAKTVCQDIDLCPRPPGYVHLLGGKKCTYGPSYWCANEANAKACNAEVHCKEHVWNK